MSVPTTEASGMAELIARVVALRREGRSSEAIAPLRRILALEPGSRAAGLELAQVLLESGRTREAVPYVAAAVRQPPAEARIFMVLAAAHHNLGDAAAARVNFRRAVLLDPGNLGACRAFCRQSASAAQRPAVERLALRLHVLATADAASQEALFATFVGLGWRDHAARAGRRLVLIAPGDAATMRRLGLVLLGLGHTERSFRLCHRAVMTSPGSRSAVLALAATAMRLNRWQEILRAIRRLGTDATDDPELALWYGRALRALDDPSAEPHLDRAAADPRFSATVAAIRARATADDFTFGRRTGRHRPRHE